MQTEAETVTKAEAETAGEGARRLARHYGGDFGNLGGSRIWAQYFDLLAQFGIAGRR